ncbi:nonribosomal peptide synthase [Aspergillus affinis]|uniref:nonribosomal peptide synthase n=1 Tax=Aspergillus affinis TaxID=1070780 RepID=UPI0022FF3682|nr:nonribosomal peptide synthase [Aspergillus affinis]KAI9038064.1 nonribosomal peptide synthase [Aspergillus affinis]
MAQIVFDSTEVPLARFQIDDNPDIQWQVNQLGQDHSDFPLVHCLVTGTAPTTRNVIIRLSRAQHDRMCLPRIIHDLLSAYLGKVLTQPTGFATFLAESDSRVQESQSFWKHLLTGSTMTLLGNDMQATGSFSQIQARRVVPCPKLPEGATMATVVKAAWSLVLSQFTRQTDVVFGQIVNGRSSLDIADPQHIVGPCVNISPVRVDKITHSSFTDLLNKIQQQHIQALPHETLGLDDICRADGWSHDTTFGSVVDHVDSRDLLEVRVDELACKATRYSPEQPEHSATRVWVVSERNVKDLSLTIESTEEFLSMDQARQFGEHMGNLLSLALARPSPPTLDSDLVALASVKPQLDCLA